MAFIKSNDEDLSYSNPPISMYFYMPNEELGDTSAPLLDSDTGENFLWIKVGNEDHKTKRRARSHIMKVFRREERRSKRVEIKNTESKARQLRAKILEEISSEVPDKSLSKTSISANTNSIDLNSTISPIKKSLVKGTLYPDPGHHGIDPFISYPIRLDSSTISLVSHWCFRLNPDCYETAKSSFRVGSSLMLRVSLANDATFYTLLALSATHLDVARGTDSSPLGNKFVTTALNITNKNISQLVGPPSDEMIAQVVMYIGHEILYGTPQGVKSHLNGLELMVNLRGGLDSFRLSNPDLWAIIHWFDYSAACQYVCRTRFVPSNDLSCSNTLYVPSKIYKNYPKGFDQVKFIADIFLGLEVSQSASFLSFVEFGLSKSISAPFKPGSKSDRRLNIEQSHYMIAIIIISFVAQGVKDRFQITNFTFRLYKTLLLESEQWASVTVKLLERTLTEERSLCSTAEYSTMVDRGMTLNSVSWYNIKLHLMEFFENDYSCEGSLKNAWKSRLAIAKRHWHQQYQLSPVDTINRLSLDVHIHQLDSSKGT